MQQEADVVQDLDGNAVAGAAVTVIDKITGELAALFADNETTSISNPVYTDANGRYAYKANNGKYRTSVSVGGRVFPGKADITLYDPKNGAVAVLGDFDLPSSAVRASAGKRLLVGAGEQITVNVPGDFPTMQAAIDAIAAWVIASTGSVTLKFADGIYVHTAAVTFNHPYGSRIRLVGNETTPDSCVIQVSTPGFDCITVSNGNVLGYINGFKLFKTAKAPFSDNSTGLLARSGASIHCGSKMVVDNWYYGIAARDGAYIYAPFASVDHAGDVGIWAFVGSTIDCPNAVSNNASDAGNGWGYGFQAEYGSALNCSNGSATGCNIGGIASLSNSNVRALGATASGNAGSGFLARDGGTIEAHNAIANGNTRYGIEEIGDSRVFGNSLTTTGNTLASKKPVGYFDNNTLGPRLVADGDWRIDLNSAGSWFFNSSGGLQFSIGTTANAVNRWHISGGAAGQGLRILPLGSDANIAANLESKGNEVVRMASNGKTAFQAYSPSPLAVNYVQAQAGLTGQPAEIAAKGTDAVVDLRLSPKGAGSYVQVGAAFTPSADAPIVGSVALKDDMGILRRFAIM